MEIVCYSLIKLREKLFSLFPQMFPHSPYKMNGKPTIRFVVRATVNPLSNFSETVLEVYDVRVK